MGSPVCALGARIQVHSNPPGVAGPTSYGTHADTWNYGFSHVIPCPSPSASCSAPTPHPPTHKILPPSEMGGGAGSRSRCWKVLEDALKGFSEPDLPLCQWQPLHPGLKGRGLALCPSVTSPAAPWPPPSSTITSTTRSAWKSLPHTWSIIYEEQHTSGITRTGSLRASRASWQVCTGSLECLIPSTPKQGVVLLQHPHPPSSARSPLWPVWDHETVLTDALTLKVTIQLRQGVLGWLSLLPHLLLQ